MGIGRTVRAILAVLIFAPLVGCQPPTFDILAEVENGQIVLKAKGQSGLFAWSDDTIDAHYLEVATSDRVLWAIRTRENDERCTKAIENTTYREPTVFKFPIVYGRTPKCFVTVVRPQPLPSNVTIVARSESVWDGYGFFRFERTARNLSWEEAGNPSFEVFPTAEPTWQPTEQQSGASSNESLKPDQAEAANAS